MDVKDGLWDHLVCYGFITQKNEKILSGFKELNDQIERASKQKKLPMKPNASIQKHNGK